MAEKITQIAETPTADAEIIKTNITDEMQKAYLDYAMSVIVSRALPDVRDGLKPVQRRIIYSMQENNMVPSGKFNKCATVVGGVMSKYHPHGDVAIYDALVRMGQDFTLRYPLIIPQGNFGSIDDDPAAAMRYTECKMSKVAEELYIDIEKDTVDFELNDLQNYEPKILPSQLPNLLLNGVSGIAVGMATNIPPHNLGEIIDGLLHLIEKADIIGHAPTKDAVLQIATADFSSTATVEDLVQFIKGPDFPTGGIIYDQTETIQMYATGKGKIITRARLEVEEMKGGRNRIIVTEIPYQVYKAILISKIADLVKNKRIDGISDLRDESNKQGMRIVIELKKDAVAKKVENQLYKHTPLQNTFNANCVALLDNEPKLMTLKVILEEFIKHRQRVIIRRTIYLLKKAREREHILLGLKIALDNLDEVIKLIRASKDAEVAKTGLMTKFGLSEIQAQAILDMQLRKLAALERQKIEDELKQLQITIADYEDLVASPKRIIDTIKEELTVIKTKYADPRKTKVIKGKVGELSDEDLIVDENCLISISESGYIKRLKKDSYRKQGRGGKGVTGQQLKDEDSVATIRTCSTHDWAFFFTNTGKVYKMRIWEIPESSRTAKGTPVVNFLSIKTDERVQAFLTMSSEELTNEKGFVFLATKDGTVKKTGLDQFENIRTSGIQAINLGTGDSLAYAGLTGGDDEVLLTTASGQSIRFSEKDVRPMGRTAGGVTGIRLAKKGDRVVGTVLVKDGGKGTHLLTVAEDGYGKKTSLSEYKSQNRGGSGMMTHKLTTKTGDLVTAKEILKGTKPDILIATKEGKMLRLNSNQIPSLGRATQGVRLIRLDPKDSVTSVEIIDEEVEISEE